MQDYKNILVFENDMEFQGLPSIVKTLLKNEIVEYDVWFNFNYSFYHNSVENYDRLSKLNNDTLIVTYPSFVGADNQFNKYIGLFLKLKQMNIKLNIAIMYSSNFYVYLLNFLSNEENYLKKENNHGQLKNILEFHNIYNIDIKTLHDKKPIYDKIELITYDKLIESYFETHRKLKITKCKVISTNEIYDAYSIHYYENFEETTITLKIENNSNNSFHLNEIIKL